MNFILPIILSLVGGLISGGVRQRQQNQQQQQQVNLEREQREAAAEVAARRREQIQGVLASNRANLHEWAERIRRGAEYSGLEAGASREASRNVAASQAAAALSGVGDSGMAESQAGAIMADAIAQTAMARLQDQFSRESAIGQREASLQQLAAQLLSDPAFNVGSGEELTAGFDHLTGTSALGGALMGGVGSVLPLLSQWALSGMGAEPDRAFGQKVPGVGNQAQANPFVSQSSPAPWLALLSKYAPPQGASGFSTGNAFGNQFGGW